MCDERMWTGAVRAALPDAVDAETARDDTIDGMATRALAIADGPVLPIGFSMGGIVALAMARQAPERVAGLVLLDTNPADDLPIRAAARPAQQAAVRAGALERIVVEELKPNYLAARNRGNAALLALLRDMALSLGDDVFVAQSEALRKRADQRDVLPTLDVPVLVACGAEDRLCPPQWHRDMAAATRQPTLHVVEGAGHMLPLEQPARLAAMIADWKGK
ncbi:alpha/beta fold hydrolase [uncultured Sphingomonas sp.]|uniref:alpha/beta fold hydrolase n=1 Tax=uncultured Sphingomonas sp. TaxID=158754 RepID=UPI0035CA240C